MDGNSEILLFYRISPFCAGLPASLSMPLFRHAEFVTSIAKPAGLPVAKGPEIAFVGRSNAGKSSAINALVGHTRLAYVSKTPGRTQLLNLFRTPAGLYLVDLPGFGFAKVPEAVRRGWADLIERYLHEREALVGLIHIMDVRHPLTALDRQLLDWFLPSGKPVHVLLTKADKLSHGARAATLAQVRRALAPWSGQVTVQLFSALRKQGVEEVETVVGGWLTGILLEPDGAHI